jgi:hypothetical protein
MIEKIANLSIASLVLALVLINVVTFRTASAAPPTTQTKSTGIQGTVKGSPPTVAASITFPSNGQSVSTLPVKVGGTCVGDVLVKLFKNGVFAGSGQCVNGVFSISIDLFSGKNELIARVYDALDQVGPDSNTVVVTFVTAGFNTTGPRVTLTSDYAKRGANPGDNLVWPIILSGGNGPYAISVDWGDGTTQLISKTDSGQFDISHKYSSPGIYTVIIKVTDANGNSSFLQLVAVANGALAQDNQQGTGTNAAAAATSTRTVVLWWPLFVAGVLVIFSFWLGARNNLSKLRKQAEKRINY